jgi:hypothetical protein
MKRVININNSLSPQIIELRKDQDIWRLKSKSWFGTDTAFLPCIVYYKVHKQFLFLTLVCDMRLWCHLSMSASYCLTRCSWATFSVLMINYCYRMLWTALMIGLTPTTIQSPLNLQYYMVLHLQRKSLMNIVLNNTRQTWHPVTRINH